MLSYHELVELVESGVIKNTSIDNIGPASIDICLGDIIWRESSSSYNRLTPHIVDLKLDTHKGDYTKIDLHKKGGYVLHPHEFVLGHSKEIFNLPNDITAVCGLKSSHQRMGLNFLGGFCDPGWTNSVFTFPLLNANSYNRLLLSPGLRIAQLVFFKVTEVPHFMSYSRVGRYNNATEPVFSLGTLPRPSGICEE